MKETFPAVKIDDQRDANATSKLRNGEIEVWTYSNIHYSKNLRWWIISDVN